MNFGSLGNIIWFRGAQSKISDLEPAAALETRASPQHKNAGFDVKLLSWPPVLSLVPWMALNSRDKISTPATINRKLRRHAQPHGPRLDKGDPNNFLRFRPYVSKVPWHTGIRGFLSQLFPRYGNYCGPNFSSGKDGGSPVWDRRPIDWLDFCCYCHDIGYDTHHQSELLKADLAFLECLEKPNMSTKGDARVARVYKTMCLTGLRNFLIPYRTHLVKLTSGQPLIQFGWLSDMRWRGWSFQKT